MSLINRMNEPIFLKESSNLQIQIEKLKEIEPLLNSKGQAIIKQDIKYLEYGLMGENNISFELKNSHMPIYILHDIYLEHGDLSAQIDYLVFTKKLCFVIECKNLYGDIEIDREGNFIRTIIFGGRKKREGIYSPITQNQRHLELIKKIRVDKKSNILGKFFIDKYFEEFHKSVVVLANPKTVLDINSDNKEIKEKVIRVDQLVKYIKHTNKKSKEQEMSDENLLNMAQAYLNWHKEVEKDYTGKYEQYRIKTIKSAASYEVNNASEVKNSCLDTEVSVVETNIFKELKEYRLKKSREENIKPYYIYTDNQLKDLISKMPKSKEQLMSVNGFGEKKVSKYGDDIIKIVWKNYLSRGRG